MSSDSHVVSTRPSVTTKGAVLSNLIVLAAGVLLVVMHSRPNVLHWIILITGMMFIVPALINIVLLSVRGDGNKSVSPSLRVVGWISSVAALILGMIMVLKTVWFVDILVYIFGGALALGGLGLVYVLGGVFRSEGLPGWLYAGPVAVLAAGVVMICMGSRQLTDDVVTLVTGIGMIVFSVSWYAIMIAAGNSRRRAVKLQAVERQEDVGGKKEESAAQ